MEQLTLKTWKLMKGVLIKVYMGIMFEHPYLSQNVCEKLLRLQATRLMVTLCIIDPYELRKVAKPHGENAP